MTDSSDFQNIFKQLKSILVEYAHELVIEKDEPGNFYLDTAHIMKNKKPLFFGAVQTKKNYVSFHLMPVYVFPELLDGISDSLKKRMQGKSCFNFKAYDKERFEELEALTKEGFQRYKKAKYV